MTLNFCFPCLSLPSSGITGLCHHAYFFVVLGNGIQGLIYVRQVIYQLSCSPRPSSNNCIPYVQEQERRRRGTDAKRKCGSYFKTPSSDLEIAKLDLRRAAHWWINIGSDAIEKRLVDSVHHSRKYPVKYTERKILEINQQQHSAEAALRKLMCIN